MALGGTLKDNTISKDTFSEIKAVEIQKNYGNKTVLENVTINMKQQEIVGFLGPNGSGKTTLFYIVAGLVKPAHDRLVGLRFYTVTDFYQTGTPNL